MPIEPLSSATLGALLNAVRQAITDYRKSQKEEQRKKSEKVSDALDELTILLRQTKAYTKRRETGGRDLKDEESLAMGWTRVGLKLEKVGFSGLAKRCDIKGRYYADPDENSEQWWVDADVEIPRMEYLVRRARETARTEQ